MEVGEIIFVVLLAGGFLLPTAFFKQWRLFFTFLVFFVIFGFMEWLSVAQTGMSISQHFWELDKVNPKATWIIVTGMAISWITLLVHLKFRRKK